MSPLHISDANDRWNKMALGIKNDDVPSVPRCKRCGVIFRGGHRNQPRTYCSRACYREAIRSGMTTLTRTVTSAPGAAIREERIELPPEIKRAIAEALADGKRQAESERMMLWRVRAMCAAAVVMYVLSLLALSGL